MQPEHNWLTWVRRAAAAGPPRRELRLGIGDDAALLRSRRNWELAVTTDLLIEDIHFLRARDTPEVCGRRLATRALSDLAAMGAEPLAVFLSTAYPAKLLSAWPRRFYHGLLQAVHEAGAVLAGGDVAASPAPKILCDIVGIGQVPANQSLRRAGARVGDQIYVSGMLGEAAHGRRIEHRGQRARSARDRSAVTRHRHPRARWELGIALRRRASAAIDLSDGLATDLHHLCEESRVGAIVNAAALPAVQLPLALFGGEDYELLFTVPPRARLPRVAGLTRIGEITPPRGVWLHLPDGTRRRLPSAGWEHWSLVRQK